MIKTPQIPMDAVREIIRRSKSSFTRSMLILPRDKRDGMLTLYAFCRVVDDAVDEEPNPEKAAQNLDYWRHQLDCIYHDNGAPDSPVSQALANTIQQFHLPESFLREIIAGVDMDRNTGMLRPSEAKLEQYCYRVAGCVGLLSLHIFGCQHDNSSHYALALGQALQRTNILRDIRQDAGNGRIYLPLELLTRHSLDQVTPDQLADHPDLPAACREFGLLAREYFFEAERLLPSEENARLRPARMMQNVYQRYLDKMEAAHWKISQQPLHLNFLDKTRLLLRAA